MMVIKQVIHTTNLILQPFLQVEIAIQARGRELIAKGIKYPANSPAQTSQPKDYSQICHYCTSEVDSTPTFRNS